MGKLSAGKTPHDLMRATFPAGTVSGVPKIRAMQIIADLEATTRGPYGGVTGLLQFHRQFTVYFRFRFRIWQ